MSKDQNMILYLYNEGEGKARTGIQSIRELVDQLVEAGDHLELLDNLAHDAVAPFEHVPQLLLNLRRCDVVSSPASAPYPITPRGKGTPGSK